jgi:short subunit dehydrogenase
MKRKLVCHSFRADPAYGIGVARLSELISPSLCRMVSYNSKP